MRRVVFGILCVILAAPTLFADVILTDHESALRAIANSSRKTAKLAKAQAGRGVVASGRHLTRNATGSVALIDAGGLKYFINTNITFSTSSSASAGMSEASYTHAVAATTLNGGTVSSTLNDAYDGYQSICLSFSGATGPCQTGNAAYTMYVKNGPAAVDTSVPATSACTGRQYAFPIQTVGGVDVTRKVFVPNNDRFARWMNIFTNTTGSPVTFNMITGNNLGSDSNTVITGTSSGDLTADTSDLWVTTFQNYSGTTSSDPRLGHIIQGNGARVPVSFIHFADGDDNPYWAYTITLNPGETQIIVNFGVGMESKAEAASQSAAVALLGSSETQCMSPTELAATVNFAPAGSLPAMSPWMLALLGVALAGSATFLLGKQS